jgi:O-antigen/teichoic acid export membrane protein
VSSLAASGKESEGSGRFLLTVNFVFISTVMAYGLGFLAVILVSRELGTEGRGVTALYQSAINLTFVVLSLGLGSAVVYFVSRGDLSGRAAMEAGLTMTILATALTACGVGLAAVVSGQGVVYDGVPYWLAIIAVPALLQFQLFETLLRGLGRFGAMNVLNVSLPVSVLVSLIAVELAIGLTVSRAVYAWSLAFLPPVVFGYLLAGTSVWPRGLMGVAKLKPLLTFGAQSQAGNLVQLLNYRLDAYIILVLTNATGVGLYATGVSLSEGLWFIANSAAVVLLTNITGGDEAYVSRMTPLVCRSTLLITALAAIAAGAVSPFIVPLVFGAEFDAAVVPFLCLLPGTVALAGGKILSAYVFSRGRPAINAGIAVVTLIVTVVADVALIPVLDVTGAAIGATIAYSVSLILTALAYRRLSGASILEALIPRPADAGIAIDAVRGIAGRFAAR